MVGAVKGKSRNPQDHYGKNKSRPVFIFHSRETEPPADNKHKHTYNYAAYSETCTQHNESISAFILFIKPIIFI